MRSFLAGEVLLGIGQYFPRLLANKTGMQNFYTEISCRMPSISPKTSAARYASEIGKSRAFDDIKATIEESNHPVLKRKISDWIGYG